jgi:aldose 1-epimerase
MTKPTSSHTSPTISKSSFGKLSNGYEIALFTLANDNGFSVEILTWGGIIRTIKAPDKNGVSDDLVLGYDSLDQYEARHPFFGTITGRFANRIAKGIFTLDGATYTLAVNNGVNHLHGGLNGFDRKVWSPRAEQHHDSVNLVLNMLSSSPLTFSSKRYGLKSKSYFTRFPSTSQENKWTHLSLLL